MRHWILTAAALLLCLAPLREASAQQAHIQPRSRGSLADAAQQLASLAAQEAPNDPVARVSQRLANAAARGDQRRAQRLYGRTRRALHRMRQEPSDRLLDAWDQVVVVQHRGPRHHGPVTRPRPRPAPRASHTVQGAFESTPFRFVASTLDELDQQCLQFVSAIDTRFVDDVTIGSARMRNAASYWDAPALCSLVVLNASPTHGGRALATGSIEGIPFSVYGSLSEATWLLSTHVPRLTRTMRVDDLVIDGRAYRNGPSYWNPQQIASMISSQLAPEVGYRQRRVTY